jgi:hypothetical protein
LAGPSWTRILSGSIQLDVLSSPQEQARSGPKKSSIMAKSQIKAGGPTRGRKRVRNIGMNSGKLIVAKHKKRKG